MSAKTEMKRWKAKNLRHKRAALSSLGWEAITEELYNIESECSDIQWLIDCDDSLADALDGDSDEEYEFKMMFADLSAKVDQLQEIYRDNYITEYFDDFTVGILGNRYNCIGFDTFDEDWYGLTQYQSELAQGESGKRVMRLTKEQLISICGQCWGIVLSFLDLRYKYDYFKASFDILKDENVSHLKLIKDIEEAYERAASDDFYGKSTDSLDLIVRNIPERNWIE